MIYSEPDFALWREFTARERELFRLIARGQTDQEMAAQFGIAHGTVKAHMRAMFCKASVCTRTALVARMYGLAPMPEVVVSRGTSAVFYPGEVVVSLVDEPA